MESRLILLVQTYPELYDTSHSEYYNIARRDSCWEEIGRLMNEPGSDCKERWTKLRDNYRKALKRRKTKMSHKSIARPPRYEKELTFLLPHIADDDRQSNFTSSEMTTGLVITELTANEHEMFDEDELAGSPGSPSALSTSSMSCPTNLPPTLPSTKRNRLGIPIVKSEPNDLEDYLNGKSHHAQMEAHEDCLLSFFTTMAKTVKQFPIKDQIEVKRNIFNLVTEKELDIAMREDLT